MIEKEMVMKKLVEGCPSYEKRSLNYVKENYEEGEERLLYVEMSDFAEHIVALYRAGRTDEFVECFEVIETLHTQGDTYVKELATIGLLEDIQNHVIKGENLELSTFETYLGPVSLMWWRHLINFWEGRSDYVGGPFQEKEYIENKK